MSGVEPIPQGRSERFVRSVIWNWAGVSISLITGFLLSPVPFSKARPGRLRHLGACAFSLDRILLAAGSGGALGHCEIRRASLDHRRIDAGFRSNEHGRFLFVPDCRVDAGDCGAGRFAHGELFPHFKFLSRIVSNSVAVDDGELVPGIGFQSVFGGARGRATVRRYQSHRDHHHRIARGCLVQRSLYGLRDCRARNRDARESVPDVRIELLLFPQGAAGLPGFVRSRGTGDAQENVELRHPHVSADRFHDGTESRPADSDRALSSDRVRRLLQSAGSIAAIHGGVHQPHWSMSRT